ncbi:maleylacetoacetate isomerase [Cupriavidus sp. 30B13]|uniref:maleylacetoacetate isomerase n=1 Tax=Cupriavidus sp. 30B13 TaxID=3384241 RepID=UPI003B8F26DF
MKLYANEISSATSRVRIALALKGLPVQTHAVTILGDDAQNRQADYLRVNPQGLVPALLTDNGVLITQSLAIVEYLDDRFPEPPLLPADPEDRAFSRSVALAIASEIHALLPPRVAAYLRTVPGMDADGVANWNRHWLTEGLTAIETLIAGRRTGQYVAGDAPSVADIFLFPQAVGAQRAGLELGRWPHIAEIVDALGALPAFYANLQVPRR